MRNRLIGSGLLVAGLLSSALFDLTPRAPVRPALIIANRSGFPFLAQEFERRMRKFYESDPRPWRTWPGCRRHGRRAAR